MTFLGSDLIEDAYYQWQAHKTRQLLPGTSRQAQLDDCAPEGQLGERPMLFIEGADLVNCVLLVCICVRHWHWLFLHDEELRLIIFF